MALIAQDPAFQVPGIGPQLQELLVVIRFKHKPVAAARIILNGFSDAAEIGSQ